MSSTPETRNSFKTVWAEGLSRLPLWVTTNFNEASFKLLLRSWVASWAAFLLIIPFHSLNTFGNAAFFASMSSFIIPPAFPVQVFFYGMALMILGSLLGWAWGCAAMKAALAVRNQVLLLSELERAQKIAASAANPDAKFRLEVFQGSFLDARSSVVYGAFFAVGCFFFAISRAYSPKLALFSVFGTIFLDIICSYGPLFPAANYAILQSFLTSMAAYVAIGCISIVLFFPQSLNHQMLGGFSKLLVVLRQLVEVQERVLSLTEANEFKPNAELAAQIQAMTAGAFAGLQKLIAGAPMLSLEFSFGKFNGEDVKDLIEPLTILISRLAGLQNFSKLISKDISPSATQASTPGAPNSSSNGASISDDPIREGDTYLLRHLGAGKPSRRFVGTQSIHPEDILPLLHTATADLRTACCDALRAADVFITHINITRWRITVDSIPDLDGPLEALRRANEAFAQMRRLEIVEPFTGLGSLGNDGNTLPRRALFYAFVFQANLGWCADAIVQLLEVLGETTQNRPRRRLWAPTSMRLLWKILTMRDAVALSEEQPPENFAAYPTQVIEKRDPDSGPPDNFFHSVGNLMHEIYKWCKTPEAMYAFKYTFISVALWLPGVFRSSAYTNYVDKGIWAVIMAQTTLEPFMADQIYSYFARLTATAGGVAIGLVAWYIGAGNGGGSPYGIAAIFGVVIVPLLFWRIFCPSIIPPLMCAITVVLVVGYSWIDANLFLVGNPGVGWTVAWRRWLLVLIGSGASGIMMFTPPKSARKAVRLANASFISEIQQLYGMLISQWIMAEESVEGAEKSATRRWQMSRWSTQFRLDFSAANARLQTLRVRTSMAKWEGSIRGKWDMESYNQLNEVETDMLSYLAQLAGAVYHLDPAWRMRLLHQTKFLNPNFIAEVMSIFSLISRSLKTGEPLPGTLPQNLIDRVFYHHGHTLPPTRDSDIHPRGDHWDQLRSPEFMAFATGVTAVYKILSLLDRLHAITTELCGKAEMRGFSQWRMDHEMQRNAL